jgi:hypothetical protein
MLNDRVIIAALAANVESGPSNGAEVTFSYAGTAAALANMSGLDEQTTAMDLERWIVAHGGHVHASVARPWYVALPRITWVRFGDLAA